MQACSTCNGHGQRQQSSGGMMPHFTTVRCNVCQGAGKIPMGITACGACHGWGTRDQSSGFPCNIISKVQCKPCGGTGRLSKGTTCCNTCNSWGTRQQSSGGMMPHFTTVTCKVCQGGGKLAPGIACCGTCNGWGMRDQSSGFPCNIITKVQCKVCNGHGRVQIPIPGGGDGGSNNSAGASAVNIIKGYHQTTAAAADAIVKTGFKPGSAGIAGGGIYFAMNPADTQNKAHQHGAILEAMVDVGRSKIMTHFDPKLTLAQLNAEGFDSVFLPAGDGVVSKNEYVIYEPWRVKSVKRIQ